MAKTVKMKRQMKLTGKVLRIPSKQEMMIQKVSIPPIDT